MRRAVVVFEFDFAGTVSVLATGAAVEDATDERECAPVDPQAATAPASATDHSQRHRAIPRDCARRPGAATGSGELQGEPLGLRAHAVAPSALRLIQGIVGALEEEL